MRLDLDINMSFLHKIESYNTFIGNSNIKTYERSLSSEEIVLSMMLDQ